MRDANRLSGARDRAAECRVLMDEAAKRETLAGTQLTREAEAANRRRGQADASRSMLVDSASSAAHLARDTGLADGHERALQGVSLPDGVTHLPEAGITALLRERRESEARRREEIAVIRKRLREVEAAAQARTRAQDARALHAEAFDIASEAARHAAENLLEGSAKLLAWTSWSFGIPPRAP